MKRSSPKEGVKIINEREQEEKPKAITKSSSKRVKIIKKRERQGQRKKREATSKIDNVNKEEQTNMIEDEQD